MPRFVDVHVTHVLRLSVGDDLTDDQVKNAVEQGIAASFELDTDGLYEGVELHPSKTELVATEVQ